LNLLGLVTENFQNVAEHMSLFVAIKTDNQIVLASDGLSLSSASNDQIQFTLPAQKLHLIKDTNWVIASVGHAVFGAFEQRLESEIELGQREPFDPHLEIGGPDYLNALVSMAHRAATSAAIAGLPQSWIALAGFDIHNKPMILTANPPRAGIVLGNPIEAFGAQFPTALWILHHLVGSCAELEDIRRLACFTVWELSKHEILIGSPEAGYPITSCVMETGELPQFKETSRTDMDGLLKDWETTLQTCFARAIEIKIR
jgi:20S proteasome alpha/beta subunit